MLKVSYLGPEGSFSHLLAMERWKEGCEFLPYKTINEIFEALMKKESDLALVPIENSFGGLLYDTVDELVSRNFLRSRLRIKEEISKRIKLCILGRKGEKPQRIYSHPYPLIYMRNWLKKNLPEVEIVEVSSTAEAARLSSETPGALAIASKEASKIYNLDVLYEDRSKKPKNITSFFVIGEGKNPRSGEDKTAVVFSLKHAPGTLYRALGAFAKRKINLTRIISRPHPERRKFGEYIFFVEFEGHEDDPSVKNALKNLSSSTLFYKTIGSYKKIEL
jgi:chorismate mutase/prephenate dehydratase